MFLGLGIRDRDQNFSSCWPQLEFGYKTMMLVVVVSTVSFIAFPGVGLWIPNNVERTVERFELWRLFFSFLFHGFQLRAILNCLFNLYVLYICMPDIERQYSTAYATIEVFLKVFLSNALLVAIGYPLLYAEFLDVANVFGFGLLPVTFAFMWQRVAKTPEEPTRFCWFPCLIPMKFVPWSYFLFEIAFGNPILPVAIYCLFGYFEFMVLKRRIVQLPISIYKTFDNTMPNWVKNRLGFVNVRKVEEELRGICSGGCCCRDEEKLERSTERVDVIGDGISIGGKNTHPVSEQQMRSYWLKKDEEQQIERIKNQIEIRDRKKPEPQRLPQPPETDYPEPPVFQSDAISNDNSSDFDQKSVESHNPFIAKSPAQQPQQQKEEEEEEEEEREYKDEDFT